MILMIFRFHFFQMKINKYIITHIDKQSRKNDEDTLSLIIFILGFFIINIPLVDFNDKCFPFKSGKGIINMTSKPIKKRKEEKI